MAAARTPRGRDQQSETRNIVCCLQFLANESENANLPAVSQVIHNAITRIVNLDTQEQDIDSDFAELICAFKAFVKFYLSGNHPGREELLDLISNMDRGRLEAYVH